MKTKLLAFLIFISMLACNNKPEKPDYPIQGVPFNEVKLNDWFWMPKIETNRKVTIPASFEKCEEMGRMDNFLIAGGVMEGKVKGDMPFDDTDVYKIIEGASYSMSVFPDPKLDSYVDSIINIIRIGQEKDGYLTTYKTIDSTYSPASWCPAGGRWKNLACSHELYNSGHLFEAAAAHYRATGKTNFLDIATKNADLLVRVFGAEKGKNPEVPGHQIVETGLIKLYQLTKKEEYLKLAKHFLDYRGDSTKRKLYGPYNQDHKPVILQDEAVGHAVRAVYMYAGMTDIAAMFKDKAYEKAIENIWENIVNKKTYVTGGIGSRHDGEAFGENYELPNLTSYNETCAAIANVYWNYRLFLLHGDAKYIDVLERSLYNGVISGVGIDGKSFFYPNPLECDMHYHFNRGHLSRAAWFDCSCCPTNLCRFMPSVPGYIYAHSSGNIFVNLFTQSSSTINMDMNKVAISQETNYPWDGQVKISVSPEKKSKFALRVRIPGWSGNQVLSGDLYAYVNSVSEPVSVTINGEKFEYVSEKGYAVIDREWQKGDVVNYLMPMNARRVTSNEKVIDNIGKVAIERGPIVYCFEKIDNGDNLMNITLPDTSKFNGEFKDDKLNGIYIITGTGLIENGTKKSSQTITAIPYFIWNNRGANEMKVWLLSK